MICYGPTGHPCATPDQCDLERQCRYYKPVATKLNQPDQAHEVFHLYGKALEVVAEQAEDASIWMAPETAREEYLQAALRRLHAAVEGEDATWLDRQG